MEKIPAVYSVNVKVENCITCLREVAEQFSRVYTSELEGPSYREVCCSKANSLLHFQEQSGGGFYWYSTSALWPHEFMTRI